MQKTAIKTTTIFLRKKFENRYYKFLQERENDTEREDIHLDTVGIPTVGIGTALAYKINTGKKDANDKIIYRYQMKSHAQIKKDLRPSGQRDITDAEYAIITETVNKLNTEGKDVAERYFNKDETQENLTYRLPKGEAMKNVALKEMKTSMINVMNDVERRGRQNGWSEKEIKAAKTKIGNDHDAMLALSSLRYNGVYAPKTIDALAAGNKAEAYYEIVYSTNGGNSSSQGIANRRILEANELLGDSSTWNTEQKKQWNEMRTRYKDGITQYEKEYSDIDTERVKLDTLSDFKNYKLPVPKVEEKPDFTADAAEKTDTSPEAQQPEQDASTPKTAESFKNVFVYREPGDFTKNLAKGLGLSGNGTGV